jgi:radical SAM superfamily enzyme YgiQ (UPF0313 family)
VVISGQLIQTDRIKELAQIFKEKGIYIIIGGTQATLYEEEFMQNGVTVISGEGERVFLKFLEDFKKGSPLPTLPKPYRYR